MHPSDRHYRNQTVRLADLTVLNDVIEGVTFENCVIQGPAVVALMGQGSLTNSSFDAPSLDSVLWVIPDARNPVVGAVALVNCHIVGCALQRIGLAVLEKDDPWLRSKLAETWDG
jgi:hypothetical protein